MENMGARLQPSTPAKPTICGVAIHRYRYMSLDRRIYLTTAITAIVIGSAVVLAAARDPFSNVMTIPAETTAPARFVPTTTGALVPAEDGTAIRVARAEIRL